MKNSAGLDFIFLPVELWALFTLVRRNAPVVVVVLMLFVALKALNRGQQVALAPFFQWGNRHRTDVTCQSHPAAELRKSASSPDSQPGALTAGPNLLLTPVLHRSAHSGSKGWEMNS